ncbi:MAG TPA: hypothetical protein VFF65_12795, partial [Phycisphaerales bacterium]|nr:hypothetical protein [Phycisphaerales bacterium]
LLLDRNVRAPFWQLKRDGRLRFAGAVFLAVTILLVGVGVQGLAIKLAYWKGESIAARLTRTDESWQAAGVRYQPTDRDNADARAAIAAIRFAGAIGDGGIAFMTSPAQHERLSYLHAYIGENAEAERHLVELVNGTAPKAEWLQPLLAFYAARNAPFEEQESHLRALERRWPRSDTPIAFRADLYGRAQRIADAIAIANDGLQRFPDSAALHERLALGLWAQGRPGDAEKAITAMRTAAEKEPTVQRWGTLSEMLQRLGRTPEAMAADAKARGLAGERSMQGNPGQTTGHSQRGPDGEPPSATK